MVCTGKIQPFPWTNKYKAADVADVLLGPDEDKWEQMVLEAKKLLEKKRYEWWSFHLDQSPRHISRGEPILSNRTEFEERL